MLRRGTSFLTLAFAVFLTGAALAQTTPQTAQPAQPRNDYSKPDSWLCRPGRQDPCTVDLTTTVVAANGKLSREEFKSNTNAPIDCFYVYPTVSLDTTPNSDMTAGAEEAAVVRGQLARFGAHCRIYAPLYRQITLTALRSVMGGRPAAGMDRALAYNDVHDAWKHYLQNDNQGRGVVLIGHSQGSMVLTQLITNEIDGKPVQERIVSALLLGSNVAVPRGKDVGGSFKHMPLCRSAKQTGCVITYASFRSTVPPPTASLFGRVQDKEMVAACTNPAALAGGKGSLHAYLSAAARVTSAAAEPRPWVTPAQKIDTPFVSVPGLLTGECVSKDGASYLEVTVNADPADPRTDDISGDVLTNGQVQASWGLHLIDVHVAMGNLVEIVGQQSSAFRASKNK
nr:EstD2 [uncultured bacterium]